MPLSCAHRIAGGLASLTLLAVGVWPAGAEPTQRPLTAPPEITELSQWGLRIGETARLVIRGQHLGDRPRIAIPGLSLRQTVQNGSTPAELIVELSVAENTIPGIYPLRVQTEHGVSAALPLSCDSLPQRPASATSPASPAELPAAFSGVVTGSQRPRVYFRGLAGQRIVADVECRRLAASIDPVLEFCDARGVPLRIASGRVYLGGDPRVELRLPEDGLYFVTLHDLRYRAQGVNPFRIKLGDLSLFDAVFPPVLGIDGTDRLEPIGSGLQAGQTLPVGAVASTDRFEIPVPIPAGTAVAGPAPMVRSSRGAELVEPLAGDPGQAPVVSLPDPPWLVINGRLEQPRERDEYVFQAATRQKLRITVEAHAFDSPLDAQLQVLREDTGKLLTANDDQPGTPDPQLDVELPEGVEKIRVRVRDLTGRGGPRFSYRLCIAPAEAPGFKLDLLTRRVNLPRGGRAVIELRVNRSGYRCPIKLAVTGGDHVSICPQQVDGDQRVLVAMSHDGAAPPDALQYLRVVGLSTNVTPALHRVALLRRGAEGALAGHRDVLPVAVTPAIDGEIELDGEPTPLLKGIEGQLGLHIKRGQMLAGKTIKLSLMTTERARPVNPRNPKLGDKPLIVAVQDQPAPAESGPLVLKLVSPTDVAEEEILAVVRADIITDPDHSELLQSLFSPVFSLQVRPAVKVELTPDPLELVSETKTVFRGVVERLHGFSGPLQIGLNPLPAVYRSKKVDLTADQDEFALEIEPSAFNEEINLPLSRLIVTVPETNAKLIDRQLKIKLLPKPTQ